MTSEEAKIGEWYHVLLPSGSYYVKYSGENRCSEFINPDGDIDKNGGYVGNNINYTYCSPSTMHQLFPQYFKSEINNTYEIY